MPTATARVETPNASKYLQQLCKHWAHKFPVDNDAERGRIDLGEGRLCIMTAEPAVLVVEATAGDGDALPRLQTVIADHLKRFAFREDLVFDWRMPA